MLMLLNPRIVDRNPDKLRVIFKNSSFYLNSQGLNVLPRLNVHLSNNSLSLNEGGLVETDPDLAFRSPKMIKETHIGFLSQMSLP